MLAIPVLIGVSIIAFLILHLSPGDPAELLAGDEATQADIQLIREEFGLDKPLTTQYFRFIRKVRSGSRRVTGFLNQRCSTRLTLTPVNIYNTASITTA